MLLWLAQYFQQELGPLRVFNFITFRAVFATLTSLAIGLIAGPAVIRMLTRLKVGQAVRTDGPQTHLVKSGTPTMGGVLVLLSIGISTVLWSDWSNRFVWVVMVVTLGFGAIGWVDDYRKVVYKNPEGMSSREKYFWQSLIGLLAALYLAFTVSAPSNTEVLQLFMSWIRSGFQLDLPQAADLIVPFFKTISYPLGVFGFIGLSYFVIVGASNAGAGKQSGMLAHVDVRFEKPVSPPATVVLRSKLTGTMGALQKFDVSALVNNAVVASGSITLHRSS